MAARFNSRHLSDSVHLPAAEELLSAFKISGSFDSLRQSCMELIQSNDTHAEHIKRLQALCEECISSSPLKPTASKNDLRNQLRESITKELSKSDFQKNLESMVYNAVRQKEDQISTIITESLKSLSQVGGYIPQAAPVSSSSVSESTPKETNIEAPSAPNETALDLLDSFGLSSNSVGCDIRKKGKLAKLPHCAKHTPVASSLGSTMQQSGPVAPDSVMSEQSKPPSSKTAVNEPMSSASPRLDSPRSANKDVSSAKRRRLQISSDEEETNDPKLHSDKTDECPTTVNSDDQTVDDRANSGVEDTDSLMDNDENSSDDNVCEQSHPNVGRTPKVSSGRLKGSIRPLKDQDRKAGTRYSPHLLRKRRTSSSGPEQQTEQPQSKRRKRKIAAGRPH